MECEISEGNTSRKTHLAVCLNDCIDDCNLRSLEVLLTRDGADPNVLLPGLNYSPLHAVAGSENQEFATQALALILQHRGNPNVRGDELLTPVHVAASWGHASVLSTLLKSGGCPYLQDEIGKNAFDYAHENQHTEAIHVLSNFIGKENPGNPEPLKASAILLNRLRRVRCNDLITTSTVSSRRSKKFFRQSVLNQFSKLSVLNEEHSQDLRQEKSESCIKVTVPKNSSEDNSGGSESEDNSDDSSDSSVVFLEEVNKSSESQSTNLDTSECQSSSDPFLEVKSQSSSQKASITNITGDSNTESSSYEQRKKINLSISGIVPLNVWDEVTPSCSFAGHSGYPFSKSTKNKSVSSSSSSKELDHECERKRPGKGLSITRRSLMPERAVQQTVVTSSDFGEQRVSQINDRNQRLQDWVDSVSKQDNHNITYDLPYEDMVPNVPSGAAASSMPVNNSSVSVSMAKLDNASIGVHLGASCSISSNSTCASEFFKYTDSENGIVLLEERLTNNILPSDGPGTDRSSSEVVVPTDAESCNTDSLCHELKSRGISYGPITVTTKRLYVQQLAKHKKIAKSLCAGEFKYSQELQRSLQSSSAFFYENQGSRLEQVIVEQFSSCKDGYEARPRWREGYQKTSFTYLLLDPRISMNLPCRAADLSMQQVWLAFVKSVFYIGKGKRSRPYSHLYKAVKHWKNSNSTRLSDEKIKQIIEIWKHGLGVVCLHVFQNVIPVEAYTREAAMIDAIGLQNLCNSKPGVFYGRAATWYPHEQRLLGVYLLRKALQILLSEGERQLRSWDLA